MAKDGNMIESGKTYTLGEGASVIFNRLKVHNKISFTVKTASNTDRFGISFVRGTDSASWYSIHVNADEGKANFEKDGDDAKYLFDNKFNIPADNEYRVTIYSDQSVCVTYINDQLSFTNRIYQITSFTAFETKVIGANLGSAYLCTVTTIKSITTLIP